MTRRRIPKRHREAQVEQRGEAFAVLLDGQPAKTPKRADIAAPSRALSEAIAEEWRGEGEWLDPDAMVFTRLAVTAIDLGPAEKDQWANEVRAYFGSDLLCHRAKGPAALVARQRAEWDPVLAWAGERLGAPLVAGEGVGVVVQPERARDALDRWLAAADAWSLIGLKTAAGVAGSAVLALALQARAFPAEAVFAASRLDERFQAERWGIDAEAAARERSLEREFHAVARWFSLLDR